MTDAWEMHPETGLNPGPVWRDRGAIIANLIRDKQALEARVGELELAAINLRDDYQGAHEALAESRAEAERLKRNWEQECGNVEASVARAEAAEAETRALRARMLGWRREWFPRVSITGMWVALDAALAASPAVEGSQIPTPPATAGTDATPEPTPAAEDDCAHWCEGADCHCMTPAAEPQAEGGA